MIAFWMRRLRLGFLGSVMAAGLAFADNASGPANWPAIPVSHPSRALLISVVHAGARLVATGQQGLIITSDDNGKTWRQARVPTSETITCAAFADSRHGWAAGSQGVVLHTEDGGRDWRLQLTGEQIIPLMTAAAARFAATNPMAVTAPFAVRRAGIFAAAGPNKPFLSIMPLSAQSAIVFGAYRMTVRTDDGGKTWADWSLNVGDPLSHAIFSSARIGNAIYLAGEAGAVLRSDDQGATFSLLTSPDPSTMFGILGTQGAILTFGVAGKVFVSRDQGKSWSAAGGASNADLTGGIVLKSGAIVVVSEDGGVLESKDDGRTFQNLNLNEGMALFGLAQADNGDVVFVGSNGVRVEPESSFN